MALSGWTANKKKKITIDSSVIDSTLTDFPILISLGAAVGKTDFDMSDVFDELSTVNNKKIAVEIGDTGVECYVEIENWVEGGIVESLGPDGTVSASSIYGAYTATKAWTGDTTNPNSSRWLSGSRTFTISTGAAVGTTWYQWDWGVDNADKLVTAVRYYEGSYPYDGPKETVWKVSDTGDFTGEETTVATITWTQGSTTAWNTLETITTPTAGRYLRVYINSIFPSNHGYCIVSCWGITSTSASSANLWVKVPSISSSADTILKLYYDSTHADNTTYVGDIGSLPGQTVWDINFIAVYHMAQDPSGGAGCLLDSTSNILHGTPYGTMSTVDLIDGLYGKAIQFDGADDYIDVQNVFPFGAVSYEMLFNKDVLEATSGLLTTKTGTGGYNSTPNVLLSDNFGAIESYSVTGGYSSVSTIAINEWHYISITKNISYLESDYFDGVLIGTVARSNTGDLDALSIGAGFDGYSQVIIGEVRISDIDRSAEWIKATYYSLTDNLITYTSPIILVFIDQYYTISESLLAYIDQEYGLKEVVQNIQRYEDGAVLINILRQYYGNGTDLIKIVNQLYGNYDQLKKSNIQVYSIAEEITNILIEQYALTEDQLIAILEQNYDLSVYNPLLTKNEQLYALLGDTSIISGSISVTVDGLVIDYISIDIEGSQERYCLSCELQVATQEDYLKCKVMSDVVVVIDGQTYNFFIESRGRRKSYGNISYNVSCISHTAKLDAPYVDLITDEFLYGYAKAIVTDLALPYSIDWQLLLNGEEVNWLIPDNVLASEGETPIEIIRKIVNAVGGKVQTSPEGVLTLINNYPVSIDKWSTTSGSFVLSDLDHFFSTDETFSARDGYNVYMISDKMLSAESLTIEERPISSTEKELHIFQTPFDDALALSMKTSGGSWVDIGVGKTILEERPFNEDNPTETELVEIVNGYGKLSKPYYGHNTYNPDNSVNLQWLQTNLGIDTILEDGTIECTIKGQSLIRLRYFTKYHRWIVKDAEIEDVQFYLE